ncbi:hypothetical protein E2C00_08205 [Streptomyces sp. WAC05374]|uniref:hypothetical protein n=1 Tax=Streptomyces sp. WAC05374 TaxID=2487420 RepID=UPI001056233D|nr:hypothetical protein [Streptomyces sp. WAC05374]TDF45120.1 hypothetical protein E2B92_12385 [Streptomyces sp. WAC05374]TDF55893.1 hypothetical protein E2C02_15315 [Streptomyces sp. WAC05374]TDF59030.1 hypothetical protein E2C00_08205 [Streptomyces sp. WAC05374]
MTVCAIETAAEDDGAVSRAGFTIAANGAYAARLAGEGEALFPERWTLDGPEPYAVPLPAAQPEEPGAQVLPLVDGRVLIGRRAAGRYVFSLLYPTGPRTGELPVGAVESASLRLLPPSPDGACVYGLGAGEHSTGVWRVTDGSGGGPEHVAEIAGHCTGGAWLDRTGRILAVDRRPAGGGPVKAVAVDLERGGEVTPLLQITDGSDDRLLLADPDSGLLLIRSDAPSPGHHRLGWGVLGSTLPVRFPECLRLPDAAVTPFAVQPGQTLTPEACAVALRIDAAAGSWVGVWRPAGRRLHQLAAPDGWLAGAGLWTAGGVLRLPYTTRAVPCGLARVAETRVAEARGPEAMAAAFRPGGPVPEERPPHPATQSAQPERAGGEPSGHVVTPGVCKPVPLQQAPLTGRTARG